MAFAQAMARIRVAFFVLIRLIYVDPQLLVDQVAKIPRWPRSPRSYLGLFLSREQKLVWTNITGSQLVPCGYAVMGMHHITTSYTVIPLHC